METFSFGPNEKMKFTEPLDTWLSAGLRDFAVPEAIGSSARVFNLDFAPLTADYANSPAIKIMRHDKIQYALPLFESEIRILTKMHDVTGVTPMLSLGFVKLDTGTLPDEIAPLSTSLQMRASADQVAGSFELYEPGESETVLEQLEIRVAEDWLAAIVLPRRWEDNLFLRCDAGYTRGDFHRSFPVLDALRAVLQICDIMQNAHDREIVYLDHKALHYYWNEPRQQVYVLDWNIGRLIANGNSTEVYAFDVLQFSARAMHHLLTGRQAPGSVKVGPNRPEDIQNAPHQYEPVWTYDDQKRLNQDELDLLGAAIQGQYQTFSGLAQDLQSLYNQRQSQS